MTHTHTLFFFICIKFFDWNFSHMEFSLKLRLISTNTRINIHCIRGRIAYFMRTRGYTKNIIFFVHSLVLHLSFDRFANLKRHLNLNQFFLSKSLNETKFIDFIFIFFSLTFSVCTFFFFSVCFDRVFFVCVLNFVVLIVVLILSLIVVFLIHFFI